MVGRKRWIKWFHLEKGSFRHFFTLFFLLLMIPILLLGAILFFKLDHQIDLDLEAQHRKSLSEIEFMIDQKLQAVESYAMQLSGSSWVQEITYMQNQRIDDKRISAQDISGYTEQLRIHQTLTPYIFCESILFVDKDYVISSRGISSGKKFYNELFPCEGLDYQKLLSSMENNFGGFFLRVRNLKDNSQMRDGINNGDALAYICPLNKNMLNRTVMVSYIPLSNIKKMIAEHVDPSVYPIIIYNAAGQQILDLLAPRQVPVNAKILSLHSDSSNMDYQLVLSHDVISASKRPLWAASAAVMVLLLCLVALVSYTLSNRQLAPLQELCNLLGSDEKNQPKTNVDYSRLEDLITVLMNKEEVLQEQYESFQPIVRNALVLKLLNGIPAEREMSVVTQFYSKLFEHPLFMVCLFVSGKQIDRERLKEHIDAQQGALAFCVEVQGMVTAIVLNYSQDMDKWELIENLDYIIEDQHANFGALLVGNTYNTINGIHNSYVESLELMDYRQPGMDAQVMLYNEMMLNDSTFYYPINTEMQILSCLQSGDLETAKGLVRGIIERNGEREELTLNKARILAYSLIGTALRGFQNERRSDEICISYHKIDGMRSVEEIIESVYSVYREVGKRIIDQNRFEDSMLVAKVDRFMEDNFCKPGMSLSMLAAYMEQPEYYVSRFFKKAYGMNFLECLHRKRLKKAKELLVKGEVIREVALRTGYSNDITFRRTFKKYEGVVPHEYRLILDRKE